MSFEMTVNMDNAAFEDEGASELARIVRIVADRIKQGAFSGYCTDSNGNRVGDWQVEDD